uniref:Uncharacterized protein n=1 Tax=Arundo donax TaxID=35708 RepID=A0A0A9DCB4_ARUDO
MMRKSTSRNYQTRIKSKQRKNKDLNQLRLCSKLL